MAQVKAVPEGLHTITPQLAIDGCAKAMEWYKKAFGAEETGRAPDPTGQKVWHASMRIGSSQFFLNDVFPDMGGSAQTASLWIYTENVDQAWKRAIEAGGQREVGARALRGTALVWPCVRLRHRAARLGGAGRRSAPRPSDRR